MKGGKNIEKKKTRVVKCSVSEEAFKVFKRLLKIQKLTQQTVLERLMFEYIGRNMEVLYKDERQ